MTNLVAANALPLSGLILALMLVAFAREWMKPSGVAVIGAAACLALGFVDEAGLLAVFSNPAVIAIGAMLILSQALVRTGVLEALASRVIALGARSPVAAVVVLMVVALVASAFLNSTPVVVILIPLVAVLARTAGIGSRRLLIPLSYVAILGGTCTLIGTSTNLLVDSIARDLGHPGFGVFDITPIGLVAAASGIAFLLLAGRFLLPSGDGGPSPDEEPIDIVTELVFEEGAEGVGEPYAALALLRHRGVLPIRAARHGRRLDPKDEDTPVAVGDRLVLRVSPTELATLERVKGIRLGIGSRPPDASTIDAVTGEGEGKDDPVDAASDDERLVARFTVVNDAPIAGLRLRRAPFLSDRDVAILGVRRHRVLAGPDLRSLRIKAGDEIFVAGARADVEAVIADPYHVPSIQPVAKPFLRDRAVFALATLALVVAVAAFGWLPLTVAAVIGIGFLLVTRSLDTDDAWSALHADVLILIYAMLIVGSALQNTGAVDALVGVVVPRLEGLPPLAVILVVYFLTSVLTETITNNGVAVIMTPVVIALADGLGLTATALVVAVMFAASASFATPIGYQTNTLVYIAGRYRFAEFLRIGLPMNVVVGTVTCVAIGAIY